MSEKEKPGFIPPQALELLQHYTDANQSPSIYQIAQTLCVSYNTAIQYYYRARQTGLNIPSLAKEVVIIAPASKEQPYSIEQTTSQALADRQRREQAILPDDAIQARLKEALQPSTPVSEKYPGGIAEALINSSDRTLFEDPSLLVFDKPRGLPIERVTPDGLGLEDIFQNAKGTKGIHAVMPLEAAASGLVICAKSPRIHGALAELFARRLGTLSYQALLAGEFTNEQPHVLADEKTKGSTIIYPRALYKDEKGNSISSALISVSAPYPLQVREAAEAFGMSIRQLHAYGAVFTQPWTNERHVIAAPPPQYMRDLEPSLKYDRPYD